MTQPIPILVTGGAGFIGSHTCKHLAQHGFLPVTLDNLSTGHADAVQWGPLERADLRDAVAVEAAMRRHQVKLVMHFAASAYVGESVQDPALYYDNNVGGMIGLLKAAQACALDKIIFSSSCATYGEPQTSPVSETCPQIPMSPYGHTKLICEEMLQAYEQAYGLRHVALRYFNAAGSDPEGVLAERHDPETHLIPLALLAAAGQRGALSVFGDDYPTPDGSCVRDYIHVQDLAHGHLLAARYLLEGGPSVALNLGSGVGQSVFDVIHAIGRITGRPVPYDVAPRRAGDPPALWACAQKAKAVLGFETRRSTLDHIIQDAAPSFGLPCNKKEASHVRFVAE
ncbi:UDP-glucose 4-epimerase GalE [Aliiroseovarius lamellibrachiae]|uniref:UDP-glucose 4-epimerase GalE n=1 Tax=Aliiroseovarius lamellibrachiae TaxID=1924933 RepID=UPI001BE0EDA0|nr:UDP-glucose 4-epimerase GalE [Aliiroseovarius lamellibrachiae]MBT2130604.1 UDP-glucose 4-epimerase GalE [Aliiroseovarius lamellibrachiae]